MLKTVAKGLGILVLAVVVAVGVTVAWASRKTAQGRARVWAVPPVALKLSVARADRHRGERLVKVLHACVECHGMDLGGGGKVIDDPLAGTVYGPNITPAALKDWSDGEVARAIRDGLGRDGRALVIMPAEDFHNLSERDLVDILAYVRGVPPVTRANRPIRVGPIVKFFYARHQMPQLLAADSIDHAAPFPPAPRERADAVYGRYLFASLCVGCHLESHRGGPINGAPPDWAPAANITTDALGTWTRKQFMATLRTGVNPSGHQERLPMTMILKYTKDFTDVELEALWAYLQQPVADGKAATAF